MLYMCIRDGLVRFICWIMFMYTADICVCIGHETLDLIWTLNTVFAFFRSFVCFAVIVIAVVLFPSSYELYSRKLFCMFFLLFFLFHTLSLNTSHSVIFFVGATAFFGSHFGVMCLILGHNCYGVGFSYLSSSIVVSAMFIFYIALAS